MTRPHTAMIFGLLVHASTAVALQAPRVNHDAQVLLDFKTRVDQLCTRIRTHLYASSSRSRGYSLG